MAQQIQFVQLAQSEYDGLSSKSPGNIYFTSDTHRIYKGSDLYAATTFDQLNFNEIDASSLTVSGSAVALEGHTHSVADVSGLSEALSSIAAAEHTHEMSEVNGLSNVLSGKAETIHSHAISDVNGLSASLSSIESRLTGITTSTITKDSVTADVGTFRLLSVSGSATFSITNVSANSVTVNGTSVALEGHTHSVADISDFGNYADASHSHSTADITGFDQAAINAGTSVFASSSHTHQLSEVVGAVPIVFMSLSAYEQLGSQVNANTIYFVSDANRIYKGSELYAATHFDELQFSSIEASDIKINDKSVATEDYVQAQIQAAIGVVLASEY